MSLKYVAAYLMTILAGNDQPSASDVKTILDTIGADIDSGVLDKLVSELEGKPIHEVIAAGMSKLSSVPTGGAVSGNAANVSSSGGGAAAAAEEEEEVKEEEEEEDDMGFSLFD